MGALYNILIFFSFYSDVLRIWALLQFGFESRWVDESSRSASTLGLSNFDICEYLYSWKSIGSIFSELAPIKNIHPPRFSAWLKEDDGQLAVLHKIPRASGVKNNTRLSSRVIRPLLTCTTRSRRSWKGNNWLTPCLLTLSLAVAHQKKFRFLSSLEWRCWHGMLLASGNLIRKRMIQEVA